MRALGTFVSCAWLLVACAASTTDGGGGSTGDDQDVTGASAPSADEARACEEGSVAKNGAGDTVVMCTKPYATAPAIRLPADATSGDEVTFYAGGTVPTGSGEFVFFTRDGKRWVPVDDHGAPIPYARGGALPKGLHATTNRMTLTIYQLTGKPGASIDSPHGSATAIRLSSARAVVEIDGCAFDSRLAGTWDGTVSERLETPQGGGPFAKAFDESKRLPIHLTLETIVKRGAFVEYDGHGNVTGQTTYILRGTIDNFDKDFDEGGKHYPSLSAMGSKNPFLGASDGSIELYRTGNMHGLPDDAHWVVTYPQGTLSVSLNGMSFTLTSFTAPSLLFDSSAQVDDLQKVEVKPHIPFTMNGHSLILAPLKTGAMTGQCPK